MVVFSRDYEVNGRALTPDELSAIIIAAVVPSCLESQSDPVSSLVPQDFLRDGCIRNDVVNALRRSGVLEELRNDAVDFWVQSSIGQLDFDDLEEPLPDELTNESEPELDEPEWSTQLTIQSSLTDRAARLIPVLLQGGAWSAEREKHALAIFSKILSTEQPTPITTKDKPFPTAVTHKPVHQPPAPSSPPTKHEPQDHSFSSREELMRALTSSGVISECVQNEMNDIILETGRGWSALVVVSQSHRLVKFQDSSGRISAQVFIGKDGELLNSYRAGVVA